MCPDDDDTVLGAFAPAPSAAADDVPTTRIDIPADRPRARTALLALAVAAGSFLVGIGAAAAVPRSHVDRPVAARALGPSGGVVRFDGGEVRVPAGALAGTRTIAVYRTVVDRRVTIDADGIDEPIVFEPGRLVAYRFTPDDITFSRPVEISFRLPEGAENGAVFARSSSDEIVVLEGTIESDRGTATTTVRHFRFTGAAS